MPDSHEFRIEKEATDVNLLTVGGEMLAGKVFVQPYSPLRQGRERPIDIMNAFEPYFPMQTDAGMVLVAKSAIAELDYEDDTDEENYGTLPVGVSITLSVTMSGGKRYSGAIRVAGPVNSPRLLDFMNRLAMGEERFLAVRSEGRVRLLNRAHIETVRPKE
jgi:hypothetical protein